MKQSPTRTVTVATMNIRHDADRWEERRPLLSAGFRQSRPDIIALQEVALGIEQAALLQSDLNADASEVPYAAYVERKTGEAPIEGIGCLTRLPVLRSTRIELPGGWRVAQHLEIALGEGVTLDIVNTHLHNEPAHSEEIRAKQCAVIMDYLETEMAKGRKNWSLMGDFNAVPDSETVQRVLSKLRSAYPEIHGAEPPYTYPTPLAQDDYADPSSYHCIDYLFVSPSVQIRDIELIFTEASPGDPTLCPSDHYGLRATLAISSEIDGR